MTDFVLAAMIVVAVFLNGHLTRETLRDLLEVESDDSDKEVP